MKAALLESLRFILTPEAFLIKKRILKSLAIFSLWLFENDAPLREVAESE